MNRRFVLQGLGSIGVANLLSGCGVSSGPRVSVQILRRSLPIQLLRQAKQALSPKVQLRVANSSSVAEIYGQLQKWSLSDTNSQDLRFFSLGDYWLSQAIRSGLIEPLTLPEAALGSIPGQWRSLVQRSPQGLVDPKGQIWGAPYRWGATVLVYRTDKFKRLDWELRDWADLWRPKLSQRVSLLNQPREVIGMTLKSLGRSYNTPDLEQVQPLRQKLLALHQQAKQYSSNKYLEPLILGDVWVAMGWSSDVIPALSQDENLGVIFPQSGSAIWADVWVKAKKSASDSAEFPVSQLTQQWVEHWWSDDVANDIARFTDAAPVIPIQADQSTLTPEDFDRSEFLLPLDPRAIEQYRQLWLEMRNSNSLEA
ncbi:MAG: extracellular solute-binding protein [Cyanobacteria bacterium P01_F01_bin.42]